ncbi:MAG: hypothetical protein QOJ66_769 [Ilumatobacteraceae bacterium]
MLVSFATSCLWSSPVVADGQPVPGFGVNGVMIDATFASGRQVRPEQVVQLADGALVVSGFLQTPGQQAVQQFVARYSPLGQPDPTFGVGGVIFPSGVVRDLAPLPDGRTLVATLSATSGLSVLNPDGTIAPLATGLAPRQLVGRPDGATYALGDSTSGMRVASLIRPDTSIDTTFNPDIAALLPPGSRMGATNVAYSAPNGTVLSDGRLVVAFAYTTGSPGQVLCGLVALLSDGSHDTTFGVGGIVSTPRAVCRVAHFVDDTIRMSGDFGDPVLSFSPDGTPPGSVAPPLDDVNLEFAGTGGFYRQTSSSQIAGLDPRGNLDPSFGAGGVATLPGISIAGFSLLDSGDIVAWGTPNDNTSALALGMVDGSAGIAPQPPAVATTKFVPVVPRRILDTRDGIGAPAGAVGEGGQIDVQIAGVESVPTTGVAAVLLNVTATEATQAGYVSVYPSGTRRPVVSSLNLEAAGQTAANLVTVKVGANGKVTLFTSGGTQLVADLAGYYVPTSASSDGRLQTSTPERILDTRSGLGALQAKLPAGGTLDLQVTGRGPVPADGVSAVVLNVTADQATADGFVTVWPTGQVMPTVSNLNLTAGETRANLVVVPVGAGGAVSLFTMGGADLIADVAGWFTDSTAAVGSAGLFVPVTPVRMLDTRQEPTAPTSPVSSLTRMIGSTAVVPPNAASAVAANLTVTESGGAGYVTAWPADTTRPLVSNLNTVRFGQTVANAVIVPLGHDAVSLYTQAGAHLIIDVTGWYTG